MSHPVHEGRDNNANTNGCAFAVSPPHKTVSTTREADRVETLLLQPFTTKPTLSFDKVLVGQTETKALRLENICNNSVAVKIKVPPRKCFSVLPEVICIPPRSSTVVIFSFTPDKEENKCTVAQVQADGIPGYRGGQVSLIGNVLVAQNKLKRSGSLTKRVLKSSQKTNVPAQQQPPKSTKPTVTIPQEFNFMKQRGADKKMPPPPVVELPPKRDVPAKPAVPPQIDMTFDIRRETYLVPFKPIRNSDATFLTAPDGATPENSCSEIFFDCEGGATPLHKLKNKDNINDVPKLVEEFCKSHVEHISKGPRLKVEEMVAAFKRGDFNFIETKLQRLAEAKLEYDDMREAMGSQGSLADETMSILTATTATNSATYTRQNGGVVSSSGNHRGPMAVERVTAARNVGEGQPRRSQLITSSPKPGSLLSTPEPLLDGSRPVSALDISDMVNRYLDRDDRCADGFQSLDVSSIYGSPKHSYALNGAILLSGGKNVKQDVRPVSL